MSKPLPGPSRLSKILQNLNRAPRPTLTGVKSITLTLAQRNDHFGARHFLKEEMPRIRYANPKIDIQVNKLPKAKEEAWKPELVLEFCSSSFTTLCLLYPKSYNSNVADGRKQDFDIHNKWSSRIFEEIMESAGGNSWTRWKTERIENGLPIVDGPPQNYVPPTPRPATGAAAVLP
ncbi:hypothetical protein EDB85DRAFT_2288145 [Lactarius pseudohatsudake]|nr:hypothetical protein EDB85DRAFT_2288145 [Lactarius pseudohatsudake]